MLAGRRSDAQHSNKAGFARYFHHCLDAGMYFASSQFETGFISLAHTPEDLAFAGKAVADALAA